MSVSAFHVPSFGELYDFTGVHLQIPVLCSLHDLPEFSAYLPQRAKRRAAGKSAAYHCPSFSPLRPGFLKLGAHCLIIEQPRETGPADWAWRQLLCRPQECVGEKCRFFADCTPEFGLRELIGDELYQSFALFIFSGNCWIYQYFYAL